MLVGNECEEEVEGKLFGLEVFDPLCGSQSMVEPREGSWDLPYAIWNDRHEWFFYWHDSNSKWLLKCLYSSNAHDIVCYMRNRLVGTELARKLKKLQSFQLEKLLDLRSLGYLAQSKKSLGFAQAEVDSRKNIQQINKFRWKEDSKTPSFATLY